MRLGKLSRILSPNYGYCSKCGTTWKFVDGVSVNYKPYTGTFKLCTKCYLECSDEEKISFYLRGDYSDEEKATIIKNIKNNSVLALEY